MAERSKYTLMPGTYVENRAVASLANTVSDEVFVWENKTGATVEVTGLRFIPDTAVTGAATNNFALQFINQGSTGTLATGLSTVRTFASGTDIPVFKADSQTLAGAAGAATMLVADGSVITLDKTENGTGLTMPAGAASISYKFV